MTAIWHKALNIVKQESQLYLLTVIDSQGSAPGRTGFKMLVGAQNTLFGSIGGGVMEYKMVQIAQKWLSSNIIKHTIIKQVHRGGGENGSGMICSGSQIIAFNHISRNNAKLLEQLESCKNFLHLSHQGIETTKQAPVVSSQITKHDWHFYQQLNKKTKAHIFGAGHVSLPTSQLLKQIGFEVHLYDNRKSINTFSNNHFAHSKHIIDYGNIFQQTTITCHDYVILMTHKFTEDKQLLQQLLKHKYKYLGVLGSQNKIKILFEGLIKQGYNRTDLKTVHAPIGIKINSQSTDEIAISICAEIIKIKNSFTAGISQIPL